MNQSRMTNLLMSLAIAGVLMSCSKSTISKETYVQVMTELGCQMTTETAPAAKAIFAKHSVTQADIDAFRTDAREEVLTAATIIADNVAKCFNVTQ